MIFINYLYKLNSVICIVTGVDSVQEYGGNIFLSGFTEIDKPSMVIVKKIVGQYAKKFSTASESFESLKMSLKPVHKTEGSEKYEIKIKVMDSGKPFNIEITDRNLLSALGEGLRKMETLFMK